MKPAAIPLILIHGVGLDHMMWQGVVAALPHRRTITYDIIGHGRAHKPAGPYSLSMFVDQLSDIVDALGGEVDLVGFSMGALVAQRFASSAGGPGIHRMVLLNGVHRRSPAERQAIVDRVAEVRAGGFAATVEPALERWFTPEFRKEHPVEVAEVRRRLLANDVRAYADAYEVFATADAEVSSRVDEISSPTLVATGSDDQRSTPAMAAALAQSLPNGHSIVLPGLRHLSPIEAPGEVAALVDEFTAV
ncbi:MAG: (E)-2-((N-methylformamido)methylene)succinate hydrolase [Ilumatobacteraceae bacterium]|jgi:pimeloyl-ACP methyl ester carboxylesterase